MMTKVNYIIKDATVSDLESPLYEVRDLLYAVTSLLEPKEVEEQAKTSALAIAYKALDAAEAALDLFRQLPLSPRAAP